MDPDQLDIETHRSARMAQAKVAKGIDSHKAAVILSYREAISRLEESVQRGTFSAGGVAAAQRLQTKYREKIESLAQSEAP
jgi:hypothetical protein